jgi:C_GCAxxG_C_C family probable redox protein
MFASAAPVRALEKALGPGRRCQGGEFIVSDVEAAVELFRKGCACSQAILATYGPGYGLKDADAMRVSAGFAAGMRMAETCGVVTGAFMVLGLAHCAGSCRTINQRRPVYSAVAAFREQFRRQHGSLVCRDLLGCDITTPKGAKFAEEKRLSQTKCVELVRSAAALLEKMLADI